MSSRVPAKKRLCRVITLMVLLAAWTSAQGERQALVTRSVGKVFLDSRFESVRALQYLAQGETLTLSEGASVNLTYVSQGSQETIQGPCQIKIGSQGSQKLSGTGKLSITKNSQVRTLVPKSENLKKLGGSLQAKADLNERALVALVSEPTSAPPSVTASGRVAQAVEADSSLERQTSSAKQGVPPEAGPSKLHSITVVNLPPAVLYPEKLGGVLHWPNKAYAYHGSSFLVQLWEGSNLILEGPTEGPHLPLGKLTLKPGHSYRLVVESPTHSLKPVEASFSILSADERKTMESATESWRKSSESGDLEASIYLFTYYENHGLLLEALKVLRRVYRDHPQEHGILLALARTHLNLGRLEGARDNLEKLQSLPPGSL